MRISDWSSDVCSSDPFDEATAVLGRDDLVDVIDPGKPAEIGDPRMRAVEQPQLGLLPRRDILRELNAERSEIGPGSGEAILDHPLGERLGLDHRAILDARSEEHTSELQSLMRISYAVFCLKKKKT